MNLQRKITTSVATMAAGFLAARLVGAIWRALTGQKPPTDAEDLALPVRQVAFYAGLAGAVGAVAEVLAARAAGRAVAQWQAPALPSTEPQA